VTDENRERKADVTFCIGRALFLQLSEMRDFGDGTPVRLALRLAKPDGRGVPRVAVANVDLLDAGGRVTKSYPNDDDKGDPFITLNRHSERYIGQAVVVEGVISTSAVMRGDLREPQVTDRRGIRPDGLHFVCSIAFADRLFKAGKLNEGLRARLTLRVENQMGGYRRHVTVLKAELLGPTGEVTRTIE
jgi:hypothetical protein